ncbi:hypothetical protein ES703_36005 [subsurface metagenome]
MEEKSSNLDKRPAIEKPSLKEAVDKLYRRTKKEIEEREKKIQQKVEYAAQKAMKTMDISLPVKEELAARVAEDLKDKIAKTLRERLEDFSVAAEEVLVEAGKLDRSLKRAKEAIEDISESSSQEAFERHLRDIRRSEEKRGEV